MKKLIRTILKETIDNRIVDVLIKLKLTNVKEIKEFLEESGYDVDEIEEIYSNYFETISGLKLTPSNWMNFYFSPDKLEVVKDEYDEEYKDSIFFRKNGKVVMEQDDQEKQFWFDYDEIWSFFELYYGMEYDHIYNILGSWLKDTLKLNRYNPIRKAQIPPIWKRLSN